MATKGMNVYLVGSRLGHGVGAPSLPPVTCETCHFAAASVDAFPRAADGLRECPRCHGVDLTGVPGFRKLTEKLKARRKGQG